MFASRFKYRTIFESTRRSFATKPYVAKDSARFMKSGNSLFPGLWLLGTSLGMFVLITTGGYSRNMRFGMNKIVWRTNGSTPSNEEGWNEKYEDFKKCPEYTIRGKEVDIETFKNMWYMGKIGGVLGPGSSIIHGLPMFYYLARGRFTGSMKKFCLIYTGMY